MLSFSEDIDGGSLSELLTVNDFYSTGFSLASCLSVTLKPFIKPANYTGSVSSKVKMSLITTVLCLQKFAQ